MSFPCITVTEYSNNIDAVLFFVCHIISFLHTGIIGLGWVRKYVMSL